MQVLSNIVGIMQAPGIYLAVFQSVIYLVCIAVIVRAFFQARMFPAMPVYCVAAFGLIRSGIMYFQMLQLENDFGFVVKTIWLIAVAGYMGLMAYQAYALEKKWRLAVK